MPVTFSEQSTATFPLPAAGGRMTFIDADGDGDQDILFQTGANGTPFQYARSNGDGTYTILALGDSPFAGLTIPDHNGSNFHVGDVDGDGDLDLYVGVNGTTGSYFRNDGATFSSQSTVTFPAPLAGGRVTMADFDGDGDADMLYQTGGNGTAFQYANSNGDGTYTIVAQGASPFAGLTLPDHLASNYHVGDFDGDGDLDVWAAVNSATGSYFRNDGASFSSQSTATFPAPAASTRVMVGDFDSDGDDDILYQTGGNGTAFQYARSNGDGTFTILAQAASPFAGVTFVDHNGSNSLVGDVDGDGDDDIIVTGNSTTGEFYLANGKPPEISSSTPSDNGTGVAVGANIVLTFDESVSKGSGNIYIYRGDGVLIETISVGSAQVTGSGTTWTIDPSVTLAGLTNYYILTDDGIFADADGSIFAGISDATTLNFTTAAVNTAPTFGNLNGDTASYGEGSAVRLDVGQNATVADTTSANFDTGTLTVTITAGGTAAQDVLSIANIGAGAGQISVSGSAVSYGGVQIGTFTGGTGGAALVVTLDPDATPAATQALVRALQYSNTSENPSTATRTVTIVLTDGDGGTSATQTTSVGVTSINDAPVNVVPAGPIAAVEDGPAVAVTGLSISDVDADAATDVMLVTLTVTSGVLTINTGVGGGVTAGDVTGNGTDTVVLSGTIDEINATLANATGVQFQSTTANFHGAVTLTMTTDDQGASGNDPGMTGSGTSEADSDTVTITVAPANDPHTGGASITGTATENQVLTAGSTLADADGLGTLHYDWQRDTGAGFVSIGAADQATYTLGDADVGAVVRVVVSYTDGDGTTESSTSAGTAAIAGANDPHTGGASITGTAAEDQVLTAVSTLADVDGLGTLHYQWQRDTGSGFVNVGTDSANYTLGDADVGGAIRVIVSYVDGQGFSESATSAATGAIANVDDAAVAVDDADSTLESTVLNGTVVANDSDLDGPALTVSAVNGSAADVGTQILLTSGALLTLNGDGTYSYDPNGAFTDLSGPGSGGTNLTATDTFTYTLANGNTATVTLTIVGEDSPGDSVEGDSGDNTLTAGDGEDTLVGGGGDDTLDGGDGVDSADYSGSTGGVHIRLNGGFGDDGEGGTDTLANIENLVGSGHSDILIGAGGGNQMSGGGGADVLIGLDGNDVLLGGAGAANQMQGGLGNDDYYVEANDTVIELLNQGHDRIFTTRSQMTLVANVEEMHFTGVGNFTGIGNSLDNLIVGGTGDDLLIGGAGDDALDGGIGSDTVSYASLGGAVTANLTTGVAQDGAGEVDILSGIENLIGSAYDDLITGDARNNTLSGGAGNDLLVGGAGNDLLQGGLGVDTASYSNAASGVVVRLDLATAQDGAGGTDVLSSIENLVGSNFDDLLIADLGGNTLDGGLGSDILIGRGGNDILIGGAGAANTLYGGAGDDFYIVSANDTIHELAGQGRDTVMTDRAYLALAANIEDLIYTGEGDFAGVGNASNNVIIGGSGRDTLTGGQGDDTLNGDGGYDTAVFSGTRSQYTIEILGGGQYRVTDTVAGRDGVDILNGVEQLRFSDQTSVLGGPAAPALSAKETPGEVSPLMDDAFVLPKDMDLPQVLPDAFGGFGAADLGGTAYRPTGADMVSIDDGGLLLGAVDDHRGAHHHDDWMF